MIQSMTGYSVASGESPHGAVNLELRSVNHRFLDLQFRLPEELRVIEPGLRELIASRLARGKVECRLGFVETHKRASSPLNTALLAQLTGLELEVRRVFPEATPLAVADVLRWPGMLGPEELPVGELQEVCFDLLKRALSELVATRSREGEKLKQLLLERVGAMEKKIWEVKPRIPQLIARHQEKLTARLNEALATLDEERVRQEIALYAGKIDVDEELSRLSTHLLEVKRVLDRGGAAGKRLDFLMQELNREANTLGAKSLDVEVSQAAMELKVLIEQMREQIQNIE